jgi:hypothetical protein
MENSSTKEDVSLREKKVLFVQRSMFTYSQKDKWYKRWAKSAFQSLTAMEGCFKVVYSMTNQGCLMVYFQTKLPPVLVNFWKAFEWKVLYLSWPFGILCGHLLDFKAICYILWTSVALSPFWYIVPRKIWQPCDQCDFDGNIFLALSTLVKNTGAFRLHSCLPEALI